MTRNKFLPLLLSLILLTVVFAKAQTTSQKQSVFLTAEANEIKGELTLKWPASTDGTNYYLYKRPLGSHEWKSLATIGISETKYVDNTIQMGEAFEYRVYRASGTSVKAFGYIYGGLNKKETPFRHGLILVVDSNYIIPLESEIQRLEEDLFADGWFVYTMYASRTEKPDSVKFRIKEIYEKNADITTLFLLGNIPIPYSGNFAVPPDGHVVGSGSHTDAWPADVYYGDLDGPWTDNTVNVQTSKKQKAWNIPFDGKFDQSYIPSEVELEVGRVDLTNLSDFPDDDTTLTRYYLDKNHNFRNCLVQVSRRALVDDHFKTLNLASTGWDNLTAFFGVDSVQDKDYFTTLKENDYLWSYGCGAGSPNSCAGLKGDNRAYAKDFATDTVQTVFTILAGSYFGDWDYDNSFLRAPLASKPMALACFWGGIPKWHVFHMAMGEHIGLGTRITQENKDYNKDYFHGAFNYAEGKIHIALMGDPTLRMHPFVPPSNLTVDSIGGSKANLSWSASTDPDILGYHIYNATTKYGKYERVNDEIVTSTTYADNKARNGMNVYVVKAVKLETTASGTYYNLSNGIMDSVSTQWSVGVEENFSEADINLYPNPSDGKFYVELDFKSPQSVKIEIIDALGQIVLSENYGDQINYSKKQFDMTGFGSQLYLVKIKSETQTITKRVFVR